MSSSLRLRGVAFAHRHDVPLLSGVELHLPNGFTAVVGPNGAGKTTLLRLLAGTLAPTAGVREGPEAVHLCPQEVGEPDDAVFAFAWGWAGDRSWALQSRLGLDPAMLERWATLSPGERKRWQIGAALAAEPPVLLLDEPTNHLDVATRGLLLDILATYDGIGAVVSHDRALLERLAVAVVRVDGGTATMFPGPWAEAKAQWARDRETRVRQVEAADQQARAARRRRTEARQDAARAEAAISVRARAKSRRDTDARSTAARVRAEKGAARASRQAALARRRAQQATATRAALDVRDPLGRDVHFEVQGRKRRVLALQVPELRAGDRVLLRDVDLWVDAGDKVWLRGPNGAGKSTLVRALVAACTLGEGERLVLPQSLDGAAVLERVRDLPPAERGRVMTAVAALGVDPPALLRSARPSPGEARKLRIAEGLGAGVALLVLDEPDNHLDLPSIERLENALTGYEGAVVLITHDMALAKAVTDRTWTLEDGRVRRS